MITAAQTNLKEEFSYTSSIAHDIWRPKTDSKAFDWWHFDALSEDSRDAVIIIFVDNFIFSPRYNAVNGRLADGNKDHRIPAVAFYYYRDGKLLYSAINEHEADSFSADENSPSCKIGDSSFTFKSAPYGSGYFVSINAKINEKMEIEAHFEWLSIESDLLTEKEIDRNNAHVWNFVIPRADVTGRITVSTSHGENTDVVHFRGTGYHDHSSDNRWLPATVSEWNCGRAHFFDSTSVFCRYSELGTTEPISKLFTIRDGKLIERNAVYDESNHKRDKYGIKYPGRQTFITEDNIRLRIKNQKVIDSSFFSLRFLSELTLTLRDGKPRKTTGITQLFAPKALKFRWLDWLVNLRIGRDGKGSHF